MKCRQTILIGVALLLAQTGRSNAVTITVPNASFELPSVATPVGYNNGPVNNWNLAGGGGVFNPAGYEALNSLPANSFFNAGFPTDGSQSAFLGTGGSLTTASSLGAIQGGMTYTLQVDVARRLDISLPQYGIDLLANGTSFKNFTGLANSITAGNFVTDTLSFRVATGSPLIGQALGIMLSGGPGGTQVNFDNVRLQAVAPEPGCLMLACCGFASGAGWWLGRRKLRTKAG